MGVWVYYITSNDLWNILQENILVMITMIFGSLVAGISAEGGGAVAFPVFTKVLEISPIDARNFGLLIQSIGMGVSSFVLIINKERLLWRVIIVVSIGGIIGQILGAYFLNLPGYITKNLFSIISLMLGVSIFLFRWILKMKVYEDLPKWNNKYIGLFILVGILGGTFASQTSSGIDMLTFIFLVLLFGINEKVATLSSIVIMAFNAMIGALIHVFLIQDVSQFTYQAWLSAIPVVIFGAPLGTYLAVRINREMLINLLLFLIFIECLSTLFLVHLDPLFNAVVFILSIIFFSTIIYFRRR